MQKNNFLFEKKFKNTESAQLWTKNLNFRITFIIYKIQSSAVLAGQLHAHFSSFQQFFQALQNY